MDSYIFMKISQYPDAVDDLLALGLLAFAIRTNCPVTVIGAGSDIHS